MRIELTGPPTAGKSRLVKALKNRGVTRGPEGVIEKIPPEWEPFAGTVRKIYKETTFKSLPDKTLRSLAAAWIGDNYSKYMVFDELLILVGFSLAIRRPEYAVNYFNKVPLPEVLIILTANWRTLLSRNEARGDRSRPDKTTRCINAHKEYMPILEDRGCQILRYNTTNKSSDQIADMVIAKLGIKKGKAQKKRMQKKKGKGK